MKEHTVRVFDEEIQKMRMSVLAMGGLVEQQFSNAVAAMRNQGQGARCGASGRFDAVAAGGYDG
jgi:hypothetical protein